jgi:hypothetical protein
MPVLAGSLPYNPIPSVEPNVGVPSRYQDIQARPEAFGAQIGTAESQLGRTVGAAADTLSAEVIRRQELTNQVASDVASNKYMEGKTKLFTGDPETGDTGFMGKSGEDAIKAFPEVSTALSKLRDDIRSTLQNPRQKVQFDAETRRLHAFALEEAGRHYDQQFKVYQGETNKAKYQNATTGLAQAIATDDSAAESAYIAKQMDAGVEELRLKGTQNSPDAVNAMQQKIRGDYVKMKAENIAQKNPFAALEYVNKNVDALTGDEANQLYRTYRAQASEQRGKIAAGLAGPNGDFEGKPYGSPRGSGKWGPLAPVAIAEFNKQGASQAFIEAAMAHGLAEGGFSKEWQQAWGTAEAPEESYGHWQMNVGGELPGYRKDFGDSHATVDQVRYLMKRAEEYLPGITKTNNAEQAMDALTEGFERYQGHAPGQRRGYLAWARKLMGTPEAVGPSPSVTPIQVAAGPDQLIAPEPLPKVNFPMPDLEPGEAPDEQVPGMAKALQHIMDTVPADDLVTRQLGVKEARKQYNLLWQNQQRMLRLHNEAQKAASDKQEDNYMQRMYPGSPNPPTTEEILKDAYMTPQAKRTMVGFLNREGAADPAAQVSKANVVDLYRRMSAPDGSPDKITTEQPLRDAYVGQQITRTDHDWAVKQFRDQRSAGNETLGERKKEFVKLFEPQILGPDFGQAAGLIDPQRKTRLYNFIQNMNEKIDEYQKAGKNPNDLFNSKSPDFLGGPESLKEFMPPIKPQAAAATGLDITKLTDSDLAQHVRSGKVPYDAAAAELKRRGYTDTRESPAVQAPVR